MNPTKIYILGNSQTGAMYYFLEVELARKALRAKAQKCRLALGVAHFKEEPDRFSYVFGWEQVEVVVWIKEAPIVDDLAQIRGAF